PRSLAAEGPAASAAPAPTRPPAAPGDPAELSDDQLARALRRARELARGADLDQLAARPAVALPDRADAPRRLAELLGGAPEPSPADEGASELADDGDTAVGHAPSGDDGEPL